MRVRRRSQSLYCPTCNVNKCCKVKSHVSHHTSALHLASIKSILCCLMGVIKKLRVCIVRNRVLKSNNKKCSQLKNRMHQGLYRVTQRVSLYSLLRSPPWPINRSGDLLIQQPPRGTGCPPAGSCKLLLALVSVGCSQWPASPLIPRSLPRLP